MTAIRVSSQQATHARAAALLLLASIRPDVSTATRDLLDGQSGQCREVVDMRAMQFELSDQPQGAVSRVCLGPSECATLCPSSSPRA